MTTIEDGVAPPPEEKPKKSRARKAASKSADKKPNPAFGLIKALKFVSPAQKKNGPTNVQFCTMENHWLIASDGILTIATKIEEDLQACPHTLQLIEALSNVESELNITQLSEFSLSVASGQFRALVPCVSRDELTFYGPDEPCAVIDDRLKAAFGALTPLVTENGQTAIHSAVLLQSGTAVATNGSVIMEYWHGIDLPPNIVIPKLSAQAVAKCDKTLVQFGFSQSSATFYFEDGSFIKTQLFNERYLAYQRLFRECNCFPVPEDFFKAIRMVEPFSRDGHIYFKNGAVATQMSEDNATTYRLEGLPEDMGFQIKLLLLCEPFFKQAEFDEENKRVFFFGENVRGILMGLEIRKATTNFSDMDDDIPF